MGNAQAPLPEGLSPSPPSGASPSASASPDRPSAGDLDRLRALAPLVALPGERLGAVLAAASLRLAAPSASLFDQDAEATHLVAVLDGMVGLTATPTSGERCLIELAGPGQLIGEAGLFDRHRHTVSARAVTACRLVLIPAAALRAELETSAGFRRRMLGFLSARLRVLVRQIAQLKLMTAPQRLGAFLLGLAGRGPGPATIRLACERRVIAEMLGMTPESLSRALRQLRALGVRPEGRHDIVIENPARLRAFVSGEEA